MDTALVTFIVRTSPSTHSVHLIGSWDNFSRHYPMERDLRQAHSQWRGCHLFTDIICDGDEPIGSKRTGGLKMGSRYYYYYEIDGGIEYYDEAMPYTTYCPYLPGQSVNYLWVPTEIPQPRYRSASTSSARSEDLKIVNPANKFIKPRNQAILSTVARSQTSSSIFNCQTSVQALSPQFRRSYKLLQRNRSIKFTSPNLGSSYRLATARTRSPCQDTSSTYDIRNDGDLPIRSNKHNISDRFSLNCLSFLSQKLHVFSSTTSRPRLSCTNF